MNLGPNDVPMIIPTVMIPLTMIAVGMSVVATFIASLFGVKLKAEGPKKLLEVLLKPRILITALVLNAFIWGGVKGWYWWKNYPRLITTIEKESKLRAQPSDKKYKDDSQDVNYRSRKKSNFTATTLNQEWNFESGSGVFSTPVVSAGSVFMGNRGGLVSELDINTGKLIRNFYIGSPVTPKISIWNNALYVGEGVHDLHHARLYKFDLRTGNFAASYQTKGHIEAQSVVATHKDTTLVLVPAGADGLHAVDANTLEGRWHVNNGHTDAAVAVSEGRVFSGSGREKNDDKKNKSYAVALDFDTGSLLWKKELPGSSWMTPAVSGADVCFVVGEIYFETDRGHIVCINKKSGEHSLAFNLDEPVASMPLLLDRNLVVSTISGKLCSFNLDRKERNWCQKVESSGTAFAGPSYDNARDWIVYPSYDKGFYVLNPDTGDVIKNWTPAQTDGEWKKTYAGVAIQGDYWIFSDYVSNLRALKVSDSVTEIKKQAKLQTDSPGI